jgi:cholesterol transport system auxiliary component
MSNAEHRELSCAGLAGFVLCLMLAGLVGLAGCSFKKAHVAKETFLIEASRVGDGLRGEFGSVLRVRAFNVTSPFETKNFVYRESERGYVTDFYRQFLVAPRSMLSEVARQWLAESGLFGVVLDAASRVEPTYTLEGNVTGLYGDYRDSEAPEAVLRLHLYLLEETLDGPRVRFHRGYEASVPLEGRGAEDLVRGWCRGLAQILMAFEGDVASLEAVLER